MCVNEIRFLKHDTFGATGKVISAPCRVCWACRKNRVNDLVGRILCEYAYSDWQLYLTLTYDDRRSSPDQVEFLQKIDMRRFLQRLRNHGYRFRYLYAGEYGEQKQRSHWHVLLFGYGTKPEIAIREEFYNFKHWKFGYTYADDAFGERQIRYCAKYLVKGIDPKQELSAFRGEYVLRYSTKPLLGFEFLINWAERQAEMQVFPRTFNYVPPFASARNKYSFYGRAQFVFFDRLFELWPEGIFAPRTEWMDNAYLRYMKYKAQMFWDTLTSDEQADILADQIRVPFARRELTASERLWYIYKDSPIYAAEQERVKQWLKNLDEQRIFLRRNIKFPDGK